MTKRKKTSNVKKIAVKRRGHIEEFDERKVYGSCYAACLSASMNHVDAEKICEKVAKELKSWADKKRILTSDEVFEKTVAAMKKHHKDAAFMYETHRDIS